MESLSVKDIGVSKVKGDSAIDNPQVSSPEDIDASKIEGSSAPQVLICKVMPHLFCHSRFCSDIYQTDVSSQNFWCCTYVILRFMYSIL